MKIKLLKDKSYKFGFHLAKGEVRDAWWNENAKCYQTKAGGGIILNISKKDAKVIEKNIIGKQYGSRSAALRAIRNFQVKHQVKHFATIPKGLQFWVNCIDEGCHEIDGSKA
jgi:hypothetical protein